MTIDPSAMNRTGWQVGHDLWFNLLFVGIVAMCVVVGAATALSGNGFLAAVGIVFLIALVVSTKFRIVFLVFGGLFVFQSSSEVSGLKTAYVIGAACALAISTISVTTKPALLDQDSKRLVNVSALLGAFFVATSVWALSSGAPALDWLRDVAPLLLLAAAPVIGIDAAQAFSRSQLTVLTLSAGLLAAVGFFIYWSLRRGFLESAQSLIGLSTTALGAAAIAVAVALAFDARGGRRWAFIALSAVIAGLYFATGTRSSVAFLIIPLVAAVMVEGVTAYQRTIRIASIVVFGSLLLATAVLLITSTAGTQSAALQRLQAIPYVSDTSWAGQSTDERRSANQVAFETAKAHPLLGTGPGHEFVYRKGEAGIVKSMTLDSSIGFFAKFGLIGFGLLVFWTITLSKFVQTLRRHGAGTGATAFWSFLVFCLVMSIPTSVTEDKGLSSAVALLLAFAITDANRPLATGDLRDHDHR